MHAIESFQLTKAYGNKQAVDAVDFKVEKGETYGFLGSNGAGKSTFINMLTGIIHPSSGSFKILNHDQKSLDKVKNDIGVLPEYSSFFGDLTPLQHLKFFCRLLHTKKTNAECLYFLERVGLERAKNVKVKKFSFGMKKKLGIAQAIVHDPSLIILDEANFWCRCRFHFKNPCFVKRTK
ncbi:ABC transporter ATP-binding protein [Pseudogracilibacillus auburnensis]|uniref:ABC transporter ATP-binding protein n=1 Tax=Pseudogracilibacillus auburnensis TaxID=1494959 RepID=UPI001F60876A|nr:ABC transporter ATP-binding protein [Pseudogracilibacillus auburnensis]